MLGRPEPLRLLLGFLIGGLAISLAAGIGIVAALESSGAISNKSSHSSRPIADIVLGTAALVLGLGIRSGRITTSTFGARSALRTPGGMGPGSPA